MKAPAFAVLCLMIASIHARSQALEDQKNAASPSLSQAFAAAKNSLGAPFHYRADLAVDQYGRRAYAIEVKGRLPLVLRGQAIQYSQPIGGDDGSPATAVQCGANLGILIGDVEVSCNGASSVQPLGLSIHSSVNLPPGSACPGIDLSRPEGVTVELAVDPFKNCPDIKISLLSQTGHAPTDSLRIIRSAGDYEVSGFSGDALIKKSGLFWSSEGPFQEVYDTNGTHVGTYTNYHEGNAPLRD